jgi:putative salt-induced outer membrane protein YdiY
VPRNLLTALIPVVLLCSSSLWADQIVMKNGDRLTGTIEKSDQKALVIKTEFAGEVTVQWPAIQEINAGEPLHVSVKQGQKLVGTVKTEDGKIEVATASGGTVALERDAIVNIRNDKEEAAENRIEHPSWTQGWTGSSSVSFALTRGNSETKNLALAFTADRKTPHDHLGMYANSVFATDDAPGAVPSTTANTTQGGARFDRNFGARLFGFGGADFQTDALQDLNLRSVFSGGLGFHAAKSDRTTLDFLGGVNYTRENYSTLSRDLIAITLGEELMKKLGTSTVLNQKLYFYPDLNDTGEYRGAFNFGTVTKISKLLGWQNSFTETYVTNPPAGTKKNDVILTTGLNVSFSR